MTQSGHECVCVCVYLRLISQPRQPACQQGAESHPTLVQLLCCLGNVLCASPLWNPRQRGGREGGEWVNALTHIYTGAVSRFPCGCLVSL